MFAKGIKKISFCLEHYDQFKDLILVNDTERELGKRYELLEAISGEALKHRMNMLIESCWSAKDYFKEDIKTKKDAAIAGNFEDDLFKHDSTHIIQYIADASKHGILDKGRMKRNKFKDIEPRISKAVLTLRNNSYPGRLKPSDTMFSEDGSVPPFGIRDVVSYSNGVPYYNFDTIILTMGIDDENGNTIGDVITIVADYVYHLIEEYEKYNN